MKTTRTTRTAKKEQAFLTALRETGGNVSRACELAKLARQTVYGWREASQEFATAWAQTVEAGMDDLEQEARRRALEGVEEPVFYKGTPCGTIRKYSDTLLIFLLKGGRPEKYRERYEHSGPNGGPIKTQAEIIRVYLPDNGRGDGIGDR